MQKSTISLAHLSEFGKDELDVVSIDDGDPKWIRTTGLRIRNPALYPTELWGPVAHIAKERGLRQ